MRDLVNPLIRASVQLVPQNCRTNVWTSSRSAEASLDNDGVAEITAEFKVSLKRNQTNPFLYELVHDSDVPGWDCGSDDIEAVHFPLT